MSRNLILFFLFLNTAGASAAVKIHSVSNIQSGTLIAEVWGAAPSFREIDVRTGQAKPLPWPSPIKDEEVIGTVLMPDRFYVIAQWTSGGGKPPSVYSFDRKTKAWATEATKLNCISFDTVEIKGAQMSLECEADPLKNTKAGKVQAKLAHPSASAKALKLVFPVTSGKEQDFSFQLDGEMFDWQTIRLLKKGVEFKTLSAENLAK